MFPRRYLAGRYFAPAYFPESEGETSVTTGQVVCLRAVGSGKTVAMTAVPSKTVEMDATNAQCGDCCD